jgi:hypothetical protein
LSFHLFNHTHTKTTLSFHNVPRRLPANPLPRNPHPTRPSTSKSHCSNNNNNRKETNNTSPRTTNTTKTYNDTSFVFCIIQFLSFCVNVNVYINIAVGYTVAFAGVVARVEDGGLVWCVA